jgi:hypothetical protein
MRLFRDFVLLIGLGCVVTGLYQAWPPLAWIVGGSALCAGTLASWYVQEKAKHREQG